MSFLQVTTTLPSLEAAERLARIVVERRTAACVQVIGPVTSHYWWKGAIERAEEWMCLIKTSEARYAALEADIRSVHPYEVPEIIATPVIRGLGDYLAWIARETEPRPVDRPAQS